jgi:hypothetical protein
VSEDPNSSNANSSNGGDGRARQPVNLPQRLLAAENRIAHSLASDADGILFADYEGRITHANAAAERLLGSPGKSLEGMTCTDAFKRITAEPAMSHHAVLVIETAPVFDDNRVFAGTIIGVTERNRDRSPGLSAADAGSARGQTELRELVNDIANDFNDIMTAIIGNTSLARAEVSQEAHVYKTLAYVEKASMRARELARRLRALAHPSAVVEQEMDDEH